MLTVGVPVDDMFTVSLCHKGNGESEVSTAVKLSDAASMTVAIENPDLGLATTSACVDFTYLDPTFSLESKFKVYDGTSFAKDKWASGKLGAQLGFAFGCPGFEDVSLGVMPAF